jgi:hypothetical protein
MKQELSSEDILVFGLRHTYGRLINDGFEVLSVRPEKEIDPQILAKKNGTLYFVVVRTDVFPFRGEIPEISIINQIRKHAQKHNAECKFVSIGLTNANAETESEKKKLFKGGEFLVYYSGLQELTNLGSHEN